MADKIYLVNPQTGSRYRIDGCMRRSRVSNLPKFGASRMYSSKDLPPSVDLRSKMTPVEHQANTNSCVANAFIAAYEFLLQKKTGKEIDISRLFVYYNARRKDNPDENEMDDGGCSVAGAFEGLQEFGCCNEEMFPFDEGKVNEKPPPHCYSEALNNRMIDGMEIEVNLNEMKASLAESYPFVFLITLFESFASAETNGGRVPMPEPSEARSAQHGFHSMLAVGYSDQFQSFIVKNSWGSRWGDKGYCYIPYDYMCNPDYCSDFHAIKAISDSTRRRIQTNIPDRNTGDYPSDARYEHAADNPNDFYADSHFWNPTDLYWDSSTPWELATANYFGASGASSDKTTGAYIERVPREKAGTKNFILWIDQKSQEESRIADQLSRDQHVRIDFCETLSKAEDHLRQHMSQIRSGSATFQIICRGYYKAEDKNPLNLLFFLNQYHLKDIPVTVYTQDEHGVLKHLQNQAASIGISDSPTRLYVTSDSAKVIARCKANIAHKSSNPSSSR